MLIFLYGQDSYRSRQKLREIVDYYQKTYKNGLNLKFFDSKTLNFRDFKDELRQIAIFKEKKLLIINNSFSDSNFREKFLEEKENFFKSDDVILFYEQGKINTGNSFFKFLSKRAKCQEFKSLLGEELKDWTKKEFGKHRTGIEPEALKELCQYVGSDSWRMRNEIEKLVSFKPGKTIRKEDVRALVKPKIETDIFKTIDAVAQKNKKQALKLLHEHLEKGDSLLYLLSMVNYQFRNLLAIKDFIEHRRSYAFILKKSGLHPFVVKKSYSQAQKFSFQELKKIYRKIFQADIDIKTGRINPETALDLLIAGI